MRSVSRRRWPALNPPDVREDPELTELVWSALIDTGLADAQPVIPLAVIVSEWEQARPPMDS